MKPQKYSTEEFQALVIKKVHPPPYNSPFREGQDLWQLALTPLTHHNYLEALKLYGTVHVLKFLYHT